jgi:hypothetical protein
MYNKINNSSIAKNNTFDYIIIDKTPSKVLVCNVR